MFDDPKRKIFVLDTNVVLHDYRSIYSFKDNIVVIPITLLEEVDNFKKGHEIINFNAREFSRELETVIGNKNFSEGVPLDNGGFIIVNININRDKEFKELFPEDKPDHRILAVAYNLKKQYGNRVHIVSKDINLRMKAKSIGIIAEDYLTDMVKDIDELYKGKRTIEDFNPELINKIYENNFIELSEDLLNSIKPYPNEFFVLKYNQKSVLVRYIKERNIFKHVEKKTAYGIKPRNAEQLFSLDVLLDNNISLVTLSGKAGTGKTLMALASALECRKFFKRILLSRPIIPLSNRDMGFLPGDVNDKLAPFMKPLFDNLSVIEDQFDENSIEGQTIKNMIKEERLIIEPLAYIRGRSLSNIYFIVDEAQNLTPHEIKTIITRAGEGTKIVFTGDPYQIDTPYLDSRSNGLSYLIDKFKGQDIYAHITMEKGERSKLANIASELLE